MDKKLSDLIEKHCNLTNKRVNKRDIQKKLELELETNFKGTYQEILKEKENIKEKTEKIYKENRIKYDEEKDKIENEIKDLLFSESILKDRNIFEKVFCFAVSQERKTGWNEIISCLDDYTDLVYDCLEIQKKT